MKLVTIAVVLASTAVLAGAPVAANPLTASELHDLVLRHDNLSIAAIRKLLAASPNDASIRCALGAAFASRKDLSRADLYLAGCDTAKLSYDIADEARRAVTEVARALRDSDLAGIDIIIQPEASSGLDAEIDALPGEHFTAPRVIWVDAGHHVLRVYKDGKAFDTPVDTKARSRGPLIVKLDSPPPPKPHAGTQDFTDDAPAESQETGPPPDVKHPPLKIGIIDEHTVASSGDTIDDPLVAHETRSALGFGARAGGGVFTETGGSARIGPSLAAIASLRLTEQLVLDLRLDWSRRGSDGVDALGVTLGPTLRAVRASAFDVRVGAGVRADLRLESSTVFRPPVGMESPQLAEVANDSTVSAAAWLEVPLHALPITVGARFEQALTSLGFDVREQAMIVEVGWELR